jgi:hypothetical protein
MAQSTAGTNLVNTWHANTAQPTALVTVQWDGVNWTDETANVQSIEIQHALYDVVSGIPLMGQNRPSEARLVMHNANDRYTPDNAASPLHAHIHGGIWRVPIRIDLGYVDATNGAERLRQFTGEIETASESNAGGQKQVTLNCVDNAIATLQFKHRTTMQLDKRPDEYIQTLLVTVGGISSQLDRGMNVIPFAWCDDENVWQECQRAAAADGGWFYFAKDGTARFERMTHWLEASDHTASQATINASRMWSYSDEIVWRDVYSSVIVAYTPRRIGPETVIYESDRPIEVGPLQTVHLTALFRGPIASYIPPVVYTDFWPVTAGMTSQSSAVSIAVTAYAMQADIAITNANTHYAAYVLDFQLRGYLVEGDETQEVREDTTLSPAPVKGKIYSLRENDFIQSETQAAMGAAFLRDKLQRPRRLLGVQAVACPFLELGDRVTVQHYMYQNGVGSAVNIAGYVVGYTQRYQADGMYTMELVVLPAANLFASSNYFRVGSSAYGAASHDLFY